VHYKQVARTSACNACHGVKERLVRRLLTADDQAEGNPFAMTQEFLSMLLGVRRAGVTVAAGLLQKAGLIRYEKGQIAVTDRRGLEGVACECYGIMRRALDRFSEQQAGPPLRVCASEAAYHADAASWPAPLGPIVTTSRK
jgi:hypothetical protein